MTQTRKIRTGIIGCDTHGAYYGAMMAEHDAARLIDPREGKGLGRYTWQSGGAHFYHYTFYADRRLMTSPKVYEFEIVKVWDQDRSAAIMLSEIFSSKPQVCESFDQVCRDVDLVFIADCNGSGDTHLEYATPGLIAGVPTFVDKPFAETYADAKAMIKLADASNTPLMSASLCHLLPQAVNFRNRLVEVEQLGFGSIRAFGGCAAAWVHGVALAQNIFGTGIEAVETMGRNQLGHFLLYYPKDSAGPAEGVMINCDSGPSFHCSLFASAFGSRGAIHSGTLGDFEFPSAAEIVLKDICKMVRTKKPVFSYETMLESIAILEAAKLSQKEKRIVRLSEITG